MENIIRELINSISIELTVFLTAALPVIELRGAIPMGISLGMSTFHATAISFLGSMLPVPILLFGVRPIFNYLLKTRLFQCTIQRITNRSLRKSAKIRKYGFLGLIFFVAIPLPGTGVWTGTLAAALLDMRFKLAFPAIFIGNAIAAIVVMLLSHGLKSLF